MSVNSTHRPTVSNSCETYFFYVIFVLLEDQGFPEEVF